MILVCAVTGRLVVGLRQRCMGRKRRQASVSAGRLMMGQLRHTVASPPDCALRPPVFVGRVLMIVAFLFARA